MPQIELLKRHTHAGVEQGAGPLRVVVVAARVGRMWDVWTT